MLVEADQGGAAPAVDQPGQAGVHADRVELAPQLLCRVSASSQSRLAAAQEIGPPLLNTSAVPDPTCSAVRRSADSDPVGEGAERLGVLLVVLTAGPPVGGRLEPLLELRPGRLASLERRRAASPASPRGRTRPSRRRPAARGHRRSSPRHASRGLAVPAHPALHDRCRARSRAQPAPCRAAATAPSPSRRARRSRRRPNDAWPCRTSSSWPIRAALIGGRDAAALLEVVGGRAEDLVGLVRGLPVEVAVVDLLGDHPEAEQPVDLVEPPLLRRDRVAHPLAVVVDDLRRARACPAGSSAGGGTAGRTRRRRPAPSRPASRRGPSAGRRRWPSPSRGRRRRAVGSSGSSTRLSNRKSLWIRQLATSSGWCSSSHAITVS